jgi:hypothetical protein
VSQVIYYPNEVFTPTLPAKLTFVERATVDDKLVRALQTPGKQIVVFGHSGAGKTTLIDNKLEQIFETHITTRCMAGMTFEQIVLNAFDQLSPYYKKDVQFEKSSGRKASLQSEYEIVKAGLELSSSEKESSTSSRMLPPQLTPQFLGALMGDAKACWLIEDFHKVGEPEKVKLAQTMKVFMDVAASYPDLKVVAIGAVSTGREVVRYDQEMSGRVAEISVPLMANEELRLIIEKGARLLGLAFDSSVERQIVSLSNGLPAICHQLCLNVCFAMNVVSTAIPGRAVGQADLDAAIKMYIDDASDTLKERYDRAVRNRRQGRFDNGRIIVKALCEFDQDGAVYGNLHKTIKNTNSDYPAGNLTQYLKELQSPERGEVVGLDTASGKFYFSDPFIRAFCQAKLGVNPGQLRSTVWMKLISDIANIVEANRKQEG